MYRHTCRNGKPVAPTPSFSSQRESRALTMRQHGHGNVDAPGTWAYVPPRPLPYANTRLNDEQGSGFPLRRERRGTVAGGVTWAILTPVTMKIGHFHAHVWPWRGHGNSRRNGNPEPFSTSNQVRKCRKSLWMPPPRHYYENRAFSSSCVALARPWQFTSQRESRALSHIQPGAEVFGNPCGCPRTP